MTAPLPGRQPDPGWVERKRTPGDQLRLLLAPPSDEDVLVGDEVVYYRAPKHIMSLAEPAIETFAVLVVVITALSRPTFESFNLAALLIVLSILVLVRFVRAREWGIGAGSAAVIVGFVMVTNQIEPIVLLPAVAIFFLIRLGLLTLRWYAYEVRYLTNRRIIEATGFFGLRVASMPVTRVTDIVLSHTATGEVFGYGELRIESAGEKQALANIRFLVEPSSFHRLAVRLATKPNKIHQNGFIDVESHR